MSADGRSGRARIAVGASGTGSNLRALHAAAGRGELGGDVVLVFADRPCSAVDWAAEHGIDTALVPDGRDGALHGALAAARPDVVVLAGYMRVVGPRVLEAFAGRIACPPGNDGSSDGWTLAIRPANASRTRGPTTRM